MTTLAIHQPEYFPWLGYFDKLSRADKFVLLDSVQFDRSSLQQRTRVVGPSGPVWMSIPFVHKFPQRIDEVAVADQRWPTKHWKTLQACYGKAAGWKSLAPRLEAFYGVPRTRLVDVTAESVTLLADAFGLGAKEVVRASALSVEGTKSDLVLSICRALGATRYLSGRTGATYLDAAAFQAAGIEVVVQAFAVPDYPRARPLSAEEGQGLSALDAALWLGADAPSLLSRRPS